MKEHRFRAVTSNLIICAVLGTVLAAALFALYPADTPAAMPTGGAVYSGDPESGRVALMFNVYEGTEQVEEIAELLAERGFRATFFVGGKWAERNGDTIVLSRTLRTRRGSTRSPNSSHRPRGAWARKCSRCARCSATPS